MKKIKVEINHINNLILYLSISILILIGLLHVSWTIYQTNFLKNTLSETVASAIAEPIRDNDLFVTRQILQSFSSVLENATICVKYQDAVIGLDPDCLNFKSYQTYNVPLKNENFKVGVKFFVFHYMYAVGFFIIILALLIVLYIRLKSQNFSKKIILDIENLNLIKKNNLFSYEEIYEANKKINESYFKEKELDELKVQLDQQEQARRLAHDIKSPIMALEMFHSKYVDLSGIELLQASILRLKGIVDTFSNKRSVSRNIKVDATKVVSSINDIISEKKTIYNDLCFSFSPNNSLIECKVAFPESEMKRLLSNIINNAAEASAFKGVVEISLSKESDVVKVSIKDYGIGIKPEYLSKVLNKDFTLKKSGEGIGLYYAKQLLENYAGNIAINSIYGEGTEVHLFFKLIK